MKKKPAMIAAFVDSKKVGLDVRKDVDLYARGAAKRHKNIVEDKNVG